MSDASKAVFLSYASQDAEAARRICEALRAAGVEVWFDQSELRGGDAWDQKIRRQIKECALFMPVISANTQARPEGYFRLEWRLADQRSHLMSRDHPFIVPLGIDDLRDTGARVPESFLEVQWTRLPAGETPPAFGDRVKVLLGGAENAGPAASATPTRAARVNTMRVGDPTVEHKRPRLFRLWLLGAAFAAVIGLGISLPWRISAVGAPQSGFASDQKSPAQKLAEQAYQVAEKVALTRDALDAADALVLRAIDLERESPRAWAVRAWVQAVYLMRNFDTTAKRRQQTEALAKRALALNPNDADAVNALSVVMAASDVIADAREQMARRAAKLDPNNRNAAILLANELGRQGRFEEGRDILAQALRRNPRDVLTRFALAELHVPPGGGQPSASAVAQALEELDLIVAQQPFEGALVLKALLSVSWRGDLVGMRAALDQLEKLPVEERATDRAVYMAIWGGLLERDLQRVLRAAAVTSRPFLADSNVVMAKDWYVGLAYRAAGKENLAQQFWRSAETAVRDHMREHPDWTTDAIRLGLVLGSLGRNDEAMREVAPLEAAWREDLTPTYARLLAVFYGAVANAEKAAYFLEQALNTQRGLTDHTLLLDPRWDQLRGQPAFDAVVVKAKQRVAAAKAAELKPAPTSRAAKPAEKPKAQK
jgi:tetratricopeptide (TPR) repeat protein